MLSYFHNYTMPLFCLGLEMSDRGVRADLELLNRYKTLLERGVAAKKERFEHLTQREVAVVKKRKKGDITEVVLQGVNPSSPKQLMQWLYEELGLPKQYKLDPKTHEKKLTTDKDAIETLVKKFHKKYPALRLLGGLKQAQKMLSTWAEVALGEDGRIRTTYLELTESGRFSSKKTDDDEGLNLQNIPPWFRGVFIPDEGKVFLEGDLSQAEARITAYLAGEEEMIVVFNDSKRNIHKLNVAKIFGIPEEQVVKDSRPTQPYGMAKRCTHGWDYRLGDRHAAQITGKLTKEMEKHRIAYFSAYPNLIKWHKFIDEIALGNKTLVTPFGRVRTFLGRPPKRNEAGELFPDADLVKKMTAWVPQSTCTEYIKRGMLRMLPLLPEGAEFLMDVHDAFLLQCWPKDVECCKEIARKCVEVPLPIKDIFGKMRCLVIQLEFKVLERWE